MGLGKAMEIPTACSDGHAAGMCEDAAGDGQTDEDTPAIPSGPLDLATLLEEVSIQLRACTRLPLSARLKIKQLLSYVPRLTGVRSAAVGSVTRGCVCGSFVGSTCSAQSLQLLHHSTPPHMQPV